MATAVLNPQDCLQNPLASKTNDFTHKKTARFPNPNRSNRTRNQQRSRTRRTASEPKDSSPSKTEKPATSDLVMGQVKILKRGEPLAAETAKNRPSPPRKVVHKDVKQRGAPDKGSANKPGPDSDSGSRFFAGSFVSVEPPPPSSLPIPSFFAKKGGVDPRKDEATDGLLKILRLNLV